MQQVVDYLRANAAHDPALLVQQLRSAGHDDVAITQAWDLAFPRVAAWPRQGHSHPAPGTQEFAVTFPSTRGGMPTWAIALLVVAGLAALGAVVGTAGWLGGGDGSDRVLGDDAASFVAEEADVSEAEAKAVLDSVGGATVDGTLPTGWSRLQEGAWGTRSTGSNVLVAIAPVPGEMSLDELVTANIQRGGGGSMTFGEPRASELFGHEARTVATKGSVRGTRFAGEQTYLVVGDDLVVVNATIMSAADRDDIDRVIGQLRLT